MEWRIRTRSRMNAADHKTSQPGTRKLERPLVEVLRRRMGTLDNDQFKGASTDTRTARPSRFAGVPRRTSPLKTMRNHCDLKGVRP